MTETTEITDTGIVAAAPMLEAIDVTIAPAPTGERAHIGAIFDVDRTLLPDTTAERLFLRFLWRRGELGTRAALETARFAGRHVFAPQTIVQGVRRQRPYLRGKEAAAIERLGAECFECDIAPELRCGEKPCFRNTSRRDTPLRFCQGVFGS